MSLRRGILAALVVISLAPTAAYAHAAYKDSDPRDEATVSSPPSSVWAEYTEPVEEGYLRIFDPCGVQVDDGNTQATGYRMTVGMSADRAGTYRVDWKAASAIDPHVTSGTFTFTVTDGEPCASSDEEATAPEEDDDSGRRDRSDDTSAPRESAAARSDERAAPTDDRRKDGRDAEVKGRRQVRNRPSGNAARGDDNITLAQSAPAAERGLWDGIPFGGFLLAMAVAAAIGAAGGRIYANIMGPRR